MINILHFVSLMDRAGQETLIMNLYRTLDRKDFQFNFLCSINKVADYDSEIIANGGEIFYLRSNFLSNVKYLRYLGDVYSMYAFFKKNKKFDVLHIHNYHSFSVFLQLFAAKLAGVDRIIVHSHNSDAPHRCLHFLFRPVLSLFTIKRFACSDLAAKWMFSAAKDVCIIKNGILFDNFLFNLDCRNKKRVALGLKDKLLILHVGRFNEQKNHHFLIKIFYEYHKLHSESVLILVGRGELEDIIRLEVKELGIEKDVLFFGIRNDIAEILWASDLFLFPSLFEGLPVSLIEAQAAGLLCLTSDTISKESILNNSCYSYSLEKDACSWVQYMESLSLHTNRVEEGHFVISKGFDIKQTTLYLQNIYKNEF